ncbi:transcription initiation factor TFIID subunit 6 [Eucalyptus grandis]|uniref:Uncharacterized protein n=2 Tax=Eucalyptus grandis TaxID=71139 RepID=A0ACC3IS46_EUCGR|nr:transcription initiation factor TFIID subunit 6 [Eucalyptus grandis]KAK3404394.1 hypothetical protein EUGRSUZ_K00716 [Eucalyptus grandis]
MSIVSKESIEVIAQSIGISNLSPDAALALAPDVEYRLREVMQEAVKCMRHSRRTVLTVDDVEGALNLKNVEPIYGSASGGAMQFKRAIGHKDLFYLDDKDVDIKDVIEAPLPKAPLDTAVLCHWLAIEGVQPAIPENAPVEVITAPSRVKSQEQKEDALPVDIRLPIRHVLSRELQIYFEKITELTMRSPDSVLFKEALASLATDSGLHPLVPYFTCFIADEVSRGLNDLSLLLALLRVVRSLLHNPHINMEPYLHQLMPAVVTCLVAKRLGKRLSDNHWELRDFAANLVSSICKRYGLVYNTLQSRLTKQLINAFLNPKHTLATHYGAVQGLAALGPNVVRLLILPNLEPYLQLLEPEMLLETQKNKIKRHEAWRVYGALLHASGQSLYDRFKILPPLPSLQPGAVWKTNARVITSLSKKRGASTEHLEQQSPLKKMAVDGPINAMSTNPTPTNGQEEAAAVTPSNDSDADATPSAAGKEPNDNDVGTGSGRVNGSSRSVNMSAMLKQIWKDDLNSGRLLVSLFEQYGESLIPFLPSPELSVFL